MRLWLIDAAYLLQARRSVEPDFQFDYIKLRRRLEESGDIWRGYYLNSTPNPPKDAQSRFHSFLRAAPPRGPKLITKLYALKNVAVPKAYCRKCEHQIDLGCPNGPDHHLEREEQKGVDVGIATLALIHRDRYETLLLSSGDGDLLDTVAFLSEAGKRIELVVFSAGVSTDLQARSDHIHWINDFAENVRKD